MSRPEEASVEQVDATGKLFSEIHSRIALAIGDSTYGPRRREFIFDPNLQIVRPAGGLPKLGEAAVIRIPFEDDDRTLTMFLTSYDYKKARAEFDMNGVALNAMVTILPTEAKAKARYTNIALTSENRVGYVWSGTFPFTRDLASQVQFYQSNAAAIGHLQTPTIPSLVTSITGRGKTYNELIPGEVLPIIKNLIDKRQLGAGSTLYETQDPF